MVSSLAAQVAQNASLNASFLAESSRRKPTESYLFTGRDADQHDLESAHALGKNGFLQLVTVDPTIKAYEAHLFSDAVKDLDRTLLNKESNKELDVQIAGFLRAIGPYLLEGPAGKVIEWLVRRFRINEFNVEDVLALFLPYHESPHFAKMVTILHIPQNSPWAFLRPFKSAAKSMQRGSLVTEMLKNTEVARFVAKLSPEAIKSGQCHRTLLAFNAACLHDFILKSKTLDEGTMTFLLAALLEPLQQTALKIALAKDAILGSYVLLCVFSQKCDLRPTAIEYIVSAMSRCAHKVSTQQFLNAVIAVCEPQEVIQAFSESTFNAIIALANINKALGDLGKYQGFEKLAVPLLCAGLPRIEEEEVYALYEAAITAAPSLDALIRPTSSMLVKLYLSPESENGAKTQSRRLLSQIHQRQPSMLHSEVDQIVSDDEDHKEAAEQLIISLSLSSYGQKTGPSTHTADMILSSSSADLAVRLIAVNDLLKNVDLNGDDEDAKTIRDALRVRIQDSSPEVLDALFAKPDVMVALLADDASSYISYLKQTLFSESAKPKRAFIRAHTAFIVSHLSASSALDAGLVNRIFHDVIFPLLLFSKSRQKTSETVWEIISSNQKTGVSKHPWLSGCVKAWQAAEASKSEEDPIVKMAKINTAVSGRIADNIKAANDYYEQRDALLEHLKGDDGHGRSLAYLVVGALISGLSGEHQIQAASAVVSFMSLDRLADFSNKKVNDMAAVGQAVVAKPSSHSTLHLLQTAIVVSVTSISRPVNVPLDFLCSDAQTAIGSRYVQLLRRVYALANTASSPLALISSIFSVLGDDALAFLVGFCLQSVEKIPAEQQLHANIALKHASAFLMARLGDDKSVDYQTIVPPLLIVMGGTDKSGRQAVLDCIALLTQLAERKFMSVYCMDTLYGDRSESLQFLERDEYRRYLTLLNENSEHLLNDPSYLNILHQGHLNRSKSDKRKDSDFKQHVVCWILSHLQCLTLPSAQIALLRAVEGVSGKSKAQMVEPILPRLIDTATPEYSETYGPQLEEFTNLVISCFDSSCAPDLSKVSSSLWETFSSALQYLFSPNGPSLPRETVSASLQNGLFTALSVEPQSKLVLKLLKIASVHQVNQAICKSLLSNLVQEVPLMVLLLSLLQPADQDKSSPATKRTKLSTDASEEDRLPSLSLLAEVLASKPLPPSFDLIAKFLDTLRRLMQRSSPVGDVNYINQLLMTAIDNSASKITEIPNSTPNGIRLDVLVDLIRASDNPQTFQQALLLMANLARLSPESVLHNVMPVFTFMGSHVFHHDDAHSLNIVQQTVNSIVPVMTTSLRNSHTERLDLFIASRDFLRIFTDAANHIPRHRRTNFFIHLVDVLGPQDFLMPVSVLLVEKLANRVVKQVSEEAMSTLRLVLSLVQHYPAAVKLNALSEILEEARRIVSKVIDPSSSEPMFSEVPSTEEHSAPIETVYKRRVQALAIFVSFALEGRSAEPSDLIPGHGTSDVISHLTYLATLESTSSAIGDIRETSSVALIRAMEHISVGDFVAAVLIMLQSEQKTLQIGALNLVSERLNNVTEAARASISSNVNRILTALRVVLLPVPGNALAEPALRALLAIASSATADEAAALTAIAPDLIKFVRTRSSIGLALAALRPFPAILGPRLLPHFRAIISECANVVQEANPDVAEHAWLVLNNLLLSMSSFWGTAELTQAINLCLDASTLPGGKLQATATLTKALTKQPAAKVLLPTLAEIWPSVENAARAGKSEKVMSYFDFLKRALRNAERDVVSDQLKVIFKLFLSAFEVITPGSESQTKAIAAFVELVVKLNDTTFKPMFRRLFDWAFADSSDKSVQKRISFCDVYIALLDYFKALVTPYMSFIFQASLELLKAFSDLTVDSPDLWTRMHTLALKSMTYDDGVFWHEDKARQFSAPLIQQIPVCLRLFQSSTDAWQLLEQCLVALAENTSDDIALKSINLNVLLHTRSEETRVKLLALSCSEALWAAHAGKMLGFASETATFIAECAEDDNDDVLHASVKLKEAVESVAGAISGL